MRLKLITIYLLMISALTLFGYISYQGLSNLIDAIQSAVEPDEREAHFEKIQDLILEAENSIRMYTITRNLDYIEPYNNTTDRIQDHILLLYQDHTGDSVITGKLDQLFDLIQEKIIVQEQLILLKQREARPDFYQEVMQEISNLEAEINQPDTIRTPARVIIKEKDTVDDELLEAQEKPKKKRGFFARLFGSGKEEDEKKEETGAENARDTVTAMEHTPLKDTVTTIIDKAVDLSQPIQTTMRNILRRERMIEEQITEKELELTVRDSRLSREVAQVVSEVKEYIQVQSVEKASQARSFFRNTTQSITLVGTVAAMLFLVMIFLLMRDFQVILRTKKELETAKDNAEKLARVKEEFLAGMSHEIRTPLHAIIGFARHIKESRLSQREKEYLSIIQNSSSHLLKILNDILDFSKMDAGQMKVEKIPFDLSALLQEIVSSFSELAKEKNLAVELEIDKKLSGKYIIGDPYRIRQIIYNLISNAIKFTDEGYVKIAALLIDGGKYQLTVSDSGCGIPEDQLETVFDKFNQADSSTTRKYGGTGLGLAIVRKSIELLEGKVQVKSLDGTGTTFTVELPAEMAAKPDPVTEEERDYSRLSGKKVMIVDDDPFNLLLLEKTLKDHKVKVTALSSGQEVPALLNEQSFDAVFLDLQMPELDGYEVARRIRAGNDTLPLIALSAYINDEIRENCRRSGFNQVLSKPFEQDELLDELTGCFLEEEKKPAKKAQGKSFSEMKIDLSTLQGMGGNDSDFLDKMILIYQQNLDEAIIQFEENSLPEGVKQIQYAAHKLIPSSRHMGLNELVSMLKEMESCSLSDDNLSEAEDLLDNIVHGLKAIREQLSAGISREK